MMLTFRDVANMVDATQDVGLGPGGGEKNFPRLCEKHELLHACCSHRQNEFVQTIRRHHGYLQVLTGTIGGTWRLLKQAIPDQRKKLR